MNKKKDTVKVTREIKRKKGTVSPSPLLLPAMGASIHEVLRDCVVRIEDLELERDDITRRECSKLAPEANRLQWLIDEIVFEAIGVEPQQRLAIRARLAVML